MKRSGFSSVVTIPEFYSAAEGVTDSGSTAGPSVYHAKNQMSYGDDPSYGSLTGHRSANDAHPVAAGSASHAKIRQWTVEPRVVQPRTSVLIPDFYENGIAGGNPAICQVHSGPARRRLCGRNLNQGPL